MRGTSRVSGGQAPHVAVRDLGDKLEISAPSELMTLSADSIVITILPDGKRTLVASSTSDQTAGSLPWHLTGKPNSTNAMETRTFTR